MRLLTETEIRLVVGGSINGQRVDEFGMPRPQRPWEPVLLDGGSESSRPGAQCDRKTSASERTACNRESMPPVPKAVEDCAGGVLLGAAGGAANGARTGGTAGAIAGAIVGAGRGAASGGCFDGGDDG